ncbi:MAG: YlbF family regulator [Bacillota bacterium]
MATAVKTKTDIWLLARQLAEALEEAEPIRRFREAEDAVLADDEAVEIVRLYEARKRAVKFSRYLPREEQERRIQAFLEIEEKFNSHPKIQALWKAREELDRFMDELNRVITYPITGEDAPKIRGACGTSGGGCGSVGGCGCGG